MKEEKSIFETIPAHICQKAQYIKRDRDCKEKENKTEPAISRISHKAGGCFVPSSLQKTHHNR